MTLPIGHFQVRPQFLLRSFAGKIVTKNEWKVKYLMN